MRSSIFLAMSLALAACAPSQPDAPPSPSSALAAPAPEGVDVIIRQDDAGPVAVKVGQRVAVELIGVPTAGYLWVATEIPAFLEAAGDYGGPTSSAQLEPGFAGGSHWEGFLFRVIAAGEGDLRFEQRRPWEDADEPAVASFSVRVLSAEE